MDSAAESSAPYISHGTQSWRERAKEYARYTAIALGFSIPLSTALDNILLAALLLLWLAAGGWRERLTRLRANPIALAALGLYLLVLIGMAWSDGPLAEGLLVARKFDALLLIAVLATLIDRDEDRRRAALAFTVAIGITLLLSFALWLGVVPTGGVIVGQQSDPSVFKMRIPHGFLMAFAALLFAELAYLARGRARMLWAIASLLALFNVMLMVKGRSAYVVVAALVVLFLFRTLRWKGLFVAASLVVIGVSGAFEVSEGFRDRVMETRLEVVRWRPDVADRSSVGARLEFYHNALAIFREHPLIGVGTGGFLSAYETRVQGSEMTATRNPHNMYLLIGVQLGVLGLSALAAFALLHWISAARLPLATHTLLARGVLLTLMLGGLFNSMLIDHTESLFFAWVSGMLFSALPRAPSAT